MTDLTEIVRPGADQVRGLSAAVLSDAGYVTASVTWMPQGACRDEDPELFFPVTTSSALSQVTRARAVCRRCAVSVTCLTYALNTGQAGIWGGTTSEERRTMPVPLRQPAREPRANLALRAPPC
jgi:WhiB family redox-sensing transcriptional regulator